MLKNVSFSTSSPVTIIMGRNGSGKTTLLFHLNGILRPENGEILINGKKVDYSKKGLTELRKKVALVFQNPDDQIIAPTVWQEVAFGAKNAGKDFKRLTESAIEFCGLKGLENSPCTVLSGGMKKLLTIASAIAMDTEIILLDEPTAGLDGVGFQRIVELIKRLKKIGKKFVIATHDYDLAKAVGDYFVFLNDGKVVYHGGNLNLELAKAFGIRCNDGDCMEGKRTKEEVIGIVFSKIKPEKNEIFADIGCGTGSVSEFFSHYVSKVYAVEADENAFEFAREKLRNLRNVEVLKMHGYEFLKSYDYDIAFFGGTKDIERMLEVCKAKKVVVNAARLEVAIEVMKKMKELGIFRELILVNISKSYELANATAFKPLNPVFIVFGSREVNFNSITE